MDQLRLKFPDVQIEVLYVSSWKAVSSDRKFDISAPLLLHSFMIIWGWWNRLCPISYYISQRSPCSWYFLSAVGRWVLFLVPPKPFSVPEAEPVAFTNLMVQIPSSVPVLVPCLVAFLENRITLNQTQEDLGKHIVILEVVFLDSSSRSLYRENDHFLMLLTDKLPEPCI